MNDNNYDVDDIKIRLKSSVSPAIIAVIAAVVLSIVILIWGHFYAVSEIPWPKDFTSIFPAGAYREISEIAGPEELFAYIGPRAFREAARPLLKEDIPVDPVSTVMETLNKKYLGKAVILPSTITGFSDSSFKEAILKLRSDLNDSISKQLAAVNQLLPWDRETALDQIANKKEALTRFEQLAFFLENGRLGSPVRFPNGQIINDFEYVASKRFDGFQLSRGGSWDFKGDDPRPVLDVSFLLKAGVPDYEIDEGQLRVDKEKLQRIVLHARTEFQNEVEKTKREIADRRARARGVFYDRWYPVLIQAFVTFYMLWAFVLFFRIIRRKGLPRKSTFEVYFATNMTSIILRWIALVLVGLGMLGLVVNLLQSIFLASISISALTRIRYIKILFPQVGQVSGYLLHFITPIAQTIITIVVSWGFVLLAEYICFLSSCYHVLYEAAHKAHKGDKP
jgi:hypothetical protein